MAENFTMSEQAVGDSGGVALEKKMNQEDQEQSHRVVIGDSGGGVQEEKKKKQEQAEELSHRVVVADSGGVLEEKKKQEQENEQSHRVVVGDGGGKKKKQEETPQQNTNPPLHADADIPYKIRAMKEIMTLIGGVIFGMTLSMILKAILGRNKDFNGYVLLSMAFFIISTASAFYMDVINRRITALVISVTTWMVGWGFLAAVYDYGDLAMYFSASIIVILPLIRHALMNLNRP